MSCPFGSFLASRLQGGVSGAARLNEANQTACQKDSRRTPNMPNLNEIAGLAGTMVLSFLIALSVARLVLRSFFAALPANSLPLSKRRGPQDGTIPSGGERTARNRAPHVEGTRPRPGPH